MRASVGVPSLQSIRPGGVPILGARRGVWYTRKRAPVGTAPANVTDARTSQSRRALDTPGRDLEKVEGESPADGEPGAYVPSSRLDRGLATLTDQSRSREARCDEGLWVKSPPGPGPGFTRRRAAARRGMSSTLPDRPS